MAPARGGIPPRTPRGPQGEGMQTSLPASSPSIPAQALERACLAPPPPRGPRSARQTPDARALACVHGSPVSPGQVIWSRVTQFSNLSNRVTRNPAYLIGWFRAGRPRLARGPRFRGCARGRRGGAWRGGTGEPSPAADAQPTARSQPPAVLLEYPARDVNTLTSTHRGSSRPRDQRLGWGLRAPVTEPAIGGWVCRSFAAQHNVFHGDTMSPVPHTKPHESPKLGWSSVSALRIIIVRGLQQVQALGTHVCLDGQDKFWPWILYSRNP
uniref:uncharacterized protein LOC118530490 n=1 Tax=Halichoerus grypus TaxID=9711 RepID=UPI0016592135|nr:uncharacterized protein LOC118530490 [Halichoerus grypus]